MEMLVPPRYRSAHEGHRLGFFQAPAVRSMGAGRDLYGLRRDGTEVAVEIGLNPLETEDGTLVLASIIDITERKKAEDRLRRSLQEKDLLLKEIHHRVKNNLAVIGSLFYLQTSTTDNPETIAILTDCRERVRSMALVHERLYRSDDLASVDMADYTAELARQLHGQYALHPERIRLDLECDPTSLGIDKAIPCGLILTELLSNAFKHAFPDGREGVVAVRLRNRDGQVLLKVTDDGVGLPPEEEMLKKQSLGTRLVRSLTGQVGARLEIDQRRPGTEIRLSLEASHDDLQ
jgi:two-component sensor histidine kinase